MQKATPLQDISVENFSPSGQRGAETPAVLASVTAAQMSRVPARVAAAAAAHAGRFRGTQFGAALEDLTGGVGEAVSAAGLVRSLLVREPDVIFKTREPAVLLAAAGLREGGSAGPREPCTI